MRTLSVQEMNDILNGAVILSSGGGGPYALGEQLLNYIINSGKLPTLADPQNDLYPTATCTVVISVGAADAPLGNDPVGAAVQGIQQMNALLSSQGRQVNFIVPGETGAVNTFYALALSVATGLPVVDADSGRRSIPSLQMSTFANVSPNPMVLTGDNNEMTLYVQNTAQGDAAIRGIGSTNLFGDDATVTLWPLPALTLQSFAVLGSVSYAQGLGYTLRNAIATQQDPVVAVVNYLKGKLIFRGFITDSSQTVSGGFDLGYIRLEALQGRRVWIYNQNENLIAWQNLGDQPLGIGPDLLCYLTVDGIPFTNGDLFRAKNKQVALIGASADTKLLQGNILQAWLDALLSIGYAGSYVPIMQLPIVQQVAEKPAKSPRKPNKKP